MKSDDNYEHATPVPGDESVSLCETLDRVLNKGVVVAGEIVISVADIDLIYLGLQVMLASMETAYGCGAKPRESRLVSEPRP